jgi:aspartate racemase
MVTETAEFLIRTEPDRNNYFLMATEGTYAAGIYQNVFQKYNLNVLEPDRTDKSTIMKWIRKVKSGDYSVSPVEVEALIKKYTDKSERVILGCTELPLLAKITGAPEEYIDPSSILAHRCVEIAEKGGNQH